MTALLFAKRRLNLCETPPVLPPMKKRNKKRLLIFKASMVISEMDKGTICHIPYTD